MADEEHRALASLGFVPLHVEGLPVDVVVAMLEGISRRFPQAAWATNRDFGDGSMVINLGDVWIDELNE